MAEGGDTDPFERYFRPRPTGPHGSDDSSTDGLGIPRVEDSQPHGVIVDGARAPHVPVSPRRGHRKQDSDGAKAETPTGSAGSGGSADSTGPRSLSGARRQRRFLMVTGAMSAFVLLFSGVGWAFQGYVLGKIDKIDPFGQLPGNRPDSGPQGAMNILVAGVDRREGLSDEQIRRLKLGKFEGERSDTMMLVHVSRDHDKISVISLPRDSYIMIPAHRSNGAEAAKGAHIPARQGKLNWTYTYGGSPLMINTIEKSTGVRIDHYVEVNFVGFIKMVDALGKVTVCTEEPVNDPKSGLQLPAGKSELNGEQALAYARARYTLTGGSDLGRIDRQQQFLAALMQQALSSSTLTDPVKATRFLNASLDAVRVDKDLAKEAPALAKQLKDVSTDDVTFAKVPLSSENNEVLIGGLRQSTVLWDNKAAFDLFGKLNRDEPLVEPAPKPTAVPSPGGPAELTVAPGDITVRVRNGVGTTGLAGDAAKDLGKAGFTTVVVPGVARTGLKTTQIQYGPGREDSARTLAAAIPGARLKRVDSLGGQVQVIVGSDWKGAQKVKVKRQPQQDGGRRDDKAIQARTATQRLCK